MKLQLNLSVDHFLFQRKSVVYIKYLTCRWVYIVWVYTDTSWWFVYRSSFWKYRVYAAVLSVSAALWFISSLDRLIYCRLTWSISFLIAVRSCSSRASWRGAFGCCIAPSNTIAETRESLGRQYRRETTNSRTQEQNTVPPESTVEQLEMQSGRVESFPSLESRDYE